MLSKKREETIKDYKIRLFRNKDKYGLSNQEIADLINTSNGCRFSESTYRKWYASYNEGYNDGLHDSSTNTAISDNIINERLKNEKLKKQAQTERIETNKWIREQARYELLIERIEDSINKNFNNEYNIKNYYINNDNSLLNRDAVLFLSDQHYGTVFELKSVDGKILNKYSPEIFEQRMQVILKETVEYLNKNNINKLTVMMLGDTLDGLLRLSQLITLRWGIVDCAVKYAYYMLQWLIKLSTYIPITIYSTQGNHTRLDLLKTKKNELKRENLDTVITSIIKLGIDNLNNKYDESLSRIRFVDNHNQYIYTKLPNSEFYLFGTHGEEKDLENSLKTYQEVYDVDIDYIVAGHLHHNNIQQCGYRKGIIRVGSIIGVDSFSTSIGKCSDAAANIGIFTKDKGLTDFHTIILN